MTTVLDNMDKVTDDYRQKVLDAMRRIHRSGKHWMTAQDIANQIGTVGSTHVQSALYSLAAMGFFFMRDGDGKAKFEYQLRPSYRR